MSSYFAEFRDDYAQALQTTWEASAGLTGSVPHRRLGADVWDLLRGNPAPIQVFADALPEGCLVLVIAGSPCQQLTWAGPYQGRQGLCGNDSHLFFVVPTLVWVLASLRPDVIVHTVVENAASMQERHRDAILEALEAQEAWAR